MSEKDKENPYVSTKLCRAYRQTLKAEIKGLKNQIVLFVSCVQIIVGVLVVLASRGGV